MALDVVATQLLTGASFVLVPTGSGKAYSVEVRGAEETPLAVAERGGVVRAASGDVVLAAELRGDMPLELRAIVLATALRYDALLDLATSPSDRPRPELVIS